MQIPSAIGSFGAGMDTTAWLMVALLGLGLAASSGLNTFLPLLLLAGAAKFHLFGVQLNGSFAWLGSDTAIGVLALASIVEIAADKIPTVDHALDVIGTFSRPAAGTLAAAAVFRSADPTTAAVLGLIIGAPAAFGFHAAKAGTRAASTATTLGMANPLLSVLEDVLAIVLTVLALTAPFLVPLFLILALFLISKLVRSARRRWPQKSASHAPSKGTT
jgi:hypothetical protein